MSNPFYKQLLCLFCHLPAIVVLSLSAANVHAAGDQAPELASGLSGKPLVHAQRMMISTANPYASKVGYQILQSGGNAVDAAIAAAIVLGLTEPQSSGIGGGAFILYFDKASNNLQTYDGRETAPDGALSTQFLHDNGQPFNFNEAVNNGKAVGVPGLLRVLELMHKQHGSLSWKKLLQPAIELAEQGFSVSKRLETLVSSDAILKENAAARAYFFDNAGRPHPAGTVIKNPEFANTLKRIASNGADAFYRGKIARDIVATLHQHPRSGYMSLTDLRNYRAKQRPVVCGPYRLWKICSMGPPSAGGITLLQILGMLEGFDLSTQAPESLQAVHLFAEAGRLAYADRDLYEADPDYVNVPVTQLLAKDYLKNRSTLISPIVSMKHADPGKPAEMLAEYSPEQRSELSSTTHLSVVDAEGGALAMTSTIESQFGSRIMVDGFLLNNQMTDFSFIPFENGLPVANRIEPGKRPRSSMSPSLVFDELGGLKMVLGSPGGSAIINYVAKTLVGLLDWRLDIQQAIDLPNMGSRNHETELEKGTALEQLQPVLAAMGHPVKIMDMTSGVQGIVIDRDGLWGGADPRREGLVLGD